MSSNDIVITSIRLNLVCAWQRGQTCFRRALQAGAHKTLASCQDAHAEIIRVREEVYGAVARDLLNLIEKHPTQDEATLILNFSELSNFVRLFTTPVDSRMKDMAYQWSWASIQGYRSSIV